MVRKTLRFVCDSAAAKFLVFLSVFGLAGCGSNGTLTGKVTARGEPVVEGELVFEPIGESSEGTFHGLTDANGMMLIDYKDVGGLPAGRYKITVTRFTQRNGEPLPTLEEGETMKSNGRVIRQSFVFEKDIVSGDNAISFELSEGKFLPQ